MHEHENCSTGMVANQNFEFCVLKWTFAGNSEHTRSGFGPQMSWRWDEDTRFMEEAVEIYASVYENLSVHSDGNPDPDDLRARIFAGNVEFPGDMSKASPRSNHIKSLMLDDKPGQLHLLTGAGQSRSAEP